MTPDTLLSETLIIGVDGGATEAKAHQVVVEAGDSGPTFRLGNTSANRVYRKLDDFEPIPVATQFAERDSGTVAITPDEKRQGDEWISAMCEAVVELVAAAPPAKSVQIGIGMPGLKSPDRRGIVVINNGPRIPDYLAQLDDKLSEAGVTSLATIKALGSDADYCGIGEAYATSGMFRGVENAYYLGAGTGIADALKLRGQLVTFDEASGWIQKSWQVSSSLGPTFEKLVSAKNMNETFHRFIAGGDGANRFPEVDAGKGDPIALAWMNTVGLLVAELIFERLWTIKNGRQDRPDRGMPYNTLDRDHPYKGTILDRIIIGQRLGQICNQLQGKLDLLEQINSLLTAIIMSCGDNEMMQAYAPGGRIKQDLLCASTLRAAPALGAGIAAFLAAQP